MRNAKKEVVLYVGLQTPITEKKAAQIKVVFKFIKKYIYISIFLYYFFITLGEYYVFRDYCYV